MKFDKYEKKMKKVRTVRNGLFHMRFPILGVVLASLTTGIAIACCVGMIKEADTLQNTYYYGDEIKLEGGSAFMSDLHYEYREVGSDEWSETPPKMPGKYEYRYRTTDVFGREKYSEPKQFERLGAPITISVRSNKVEYGSDPVIDWPVLKPGDKLVDFSFKYDSFADSQTNVCVDKESIKIEDKDGNDATAGYDITTPKSNILFTKRLLNITYKSQEKPFDGYALTSEEMPETSGLLEGDRIEFLDGPVSITQVGNVKNIREVKIMKDNVDVTHLYYINNKAGTLTINKREITLVSAGGNPDYSSDYVKQSVDFQPRTEENCLAEGHELKVVFTNPDIYRWGEHKSTFAVDIVDKKGNNVNHLYKINKVENMINVKKASYYILTGSCNKAYDGSNAKNDTIYASGLKGDDKLIATSFSSQSGIGTTKNNVAYKIMRGGEDVTDCYELDEQKSQIGDLTIHKRNIVVELGNAHDKEYDGKPLVIDSNNFKVLEPSNDTPSEGLAPNHIAVADESFHKELTNVGTIDASGFKIKIYEKDQHGLPNKDRDVTNFYNVLEYIGSNNPITIRQRVIHVNTPDISHEYDGRPIYSSNPTLVDGYSLADGHSFACVNNNPAYTEVTEKGIKNEIAIKIVDKEGNDQTLNYQTIVDHYGKIDITKKAIVVKPKDATKVYDGKTYSDYAELTIDKWVNGKSQDVTVYGRVSSKQIDATEEGIITVDPNSYCVYDEYKNDITKNFYISNITTGKLRILQRDVKISVEGKEIAYNNNPNFKYSAEDVSVENMLPDDKITDVKFNVDTTPKPGTPQDVELTSYKIKQEQGFGKDVTSNYYCSELVGGRFTAYYENVVNVRSKDIVRDYNGEEIQLEETEKELIATGLQPGHRAVATKWYLEDLHLKDVKDTSYDGYNFTKLENTFEYKIVDEQGIDITNQYRTQDHTKFTKTYGEVAIKPIEIGIGSRNKKSAYDGAEHTTKPIVDTDPERGYEVTKEYRRRDVYIYTGDMLENHKLYVKNYQASGSLPGQYSPLDNAIFTVYHSLTGEIIDALNYRIVPTERTGNLIIDRINVHLTTQDYTGYYSGYGELVFDNQIQVEPGKLLPNHQVRMSLKQFYSPTYGEVDNNKYEIESGKISPRVIDTTTGYDVTEYYTFTYTFGKVNILD